MSFLQLILFFLLNTKLVHAQSLSLFYQLQSAYTPMDSSLTLQSYAPSLTPTPTPIPTPILSKVLGVQITPTPEPINVGGDGQVITIALFGDSMIDTLGTGVKSLALMLKSYYPTIKFNILNYGIGGQTVEDGYKRLSVPLKYQGRDYPSLLEAQPDIVVIESFAYNNFGNTQNGYNRHWLALSALTEELKKQLPSAKIVLASTIAPNSIVFANGSGENYTALEKLERTKTISLYLQRALVFAKAVSLPSADAYTPSLSNGDGQRSLIDPKDNIHPSSQGADFFSAILAKSIWENKLVDLQE